MSVFRSLLALSAEGGQNYYGDFGSVYTRLEYLHFTGTQYLNTQYALLRDKNWKMEFTISIDTHYNYNNIWGFMEAEDLMNESWVYQDATYYTRFGASATSDKRYIATLTANRKYQIVHDNSGAQFTSTVNGSPVTSYARCNTSSTRLLCFGHRQAGQWLKGKVYEIKMWSNGELVRHFIPARLKSTGEIGFYELVDAKMYLNAGTGAFGYKELEWQNLPVEYTPVSYLQSTGTQYINTGIAPTTINTQVEIRYEYTGNKGSGFDSVIGSRTNSDMNTRFYPTSCDGTTRMRHILGATIINSAYDLNTRHDLLFNTNDRSCVLDGNTLGNLGTSFTTHSRPMYMFGLNCEGSFSYASKSRIYYCKIWQNNVLVRHFVPCINLAQVAGFYDLVTNTFYTNAGSGTFTYA